MLIIIKLITLIVTALWLSITLLLCMSASGVTFGACNVNVAKRDAAFLQIIINEHIRAFSDFTASCIWFHPIESLQTDLNVDVCRTPSTLHGESLTCSTNDFSNLSLGFLQLGPRFHKYIL